MSALRWSEAEYREWQRSGIQPVKKQAKYRNIKVEVDGIVFDSKKEAGRYLELKTMQAAGVISELAPHVEFNLEVHGQPICTYVCDFFYHDGKSTVVEDVKSPATRTAVYRLKKKLMKACLNIEITET